jgi:hypothetical protein
MYFDFEDYRPDTPRIDAPISKRESALLSIVFHGLFFLLVLLLPPIGREAQLAAIRRAEERALLAQQQQPSRDASFSCSRVSRPRCAHARARRTVRRRPPGHGAGTRQGALQSAAVRTG